MEFILINFTTDEKQSVTRECVDRIKGRITVDSLIKKVKETGKPVEVFFEGDYDLRITNEKGMAG